MKKVFLGNSNLSISVLGVGGLHFGSFLDSRQAQEVIHGALDLGINLIDTAPLYGGGLSEEYIGRAIRGRREKVLLATKVGLKRVDSDGTFRVAVDALNETHIRKALEKSLRALGTDHMDLYQLHAFDHETPVEKTLQTLDRLMREGKIRFIGCSNFSGSEFQQSMEAAKKRQWPGFVSCQTHYNLLERRVEKELVPVCRSWGASVICNRALGRGILTGKYAVGCPPPEDSRAYASERLRKCLSERTLRVAEALKVYAQERNHTATELAIAWLLSSGNADVVLAGVRNMNQMAEWVRAMDWQLSDADKQAVDQILDKFSLTAEVHAMPQRFLET